MRPWSEVWAGVTTGGLSSTHLVPLSLGPWPHTARPPAPAAPELPDQRLLPPPPASALHPRTFPSSGPAGPSRPSTRRERPPRSLFFRCCQGSPREPHPHWPRNPEMLAACAGCVHTASWTCPRVPLAPGPRPLRLGLHRDILSHFLPPVLKGAPASPQDLDASSSLSPPGPQEGSLFPLCRSRNRALRGGHCPVGLRLS